MQEQSDSGPAMPLTASEPGHADPSGDITRLLHQWGREGDAAAGERLMETLYGTLREMAAQRLASLPRSDAVLQPTVLMHEALLRLIGKEASFRDRAHFFALAALKMRAVLVDYARAALAGKRGGDALMVTLSCVDLDSHGSSRTVEFQVLALHDALEKLAQVDPRAARAVELSYFAGMTHEEIALAIEVSVPTVERDLRIARAWLKRHLGGTKA